MLKFISDFLAAAILMLGMCWVAAMAMSPTVQASEAKADSIVAQMLEPSFKLYAGNTPLCSATAISSQSTDEGVETYFLTAEHCLRGDRMNVRKQILDDKLEPKKETIFYLKKFRAFKKEDVAVLKMVDPSEVFPVAKIAAKETKPYVGQPMWAVGYPRTAELTITSGEYTGVAKAPTGDILTRATASIYGGSSGGALFLKTEDGYQIYGLAVGGYRDDSFMKYFALLEAIHRVIPKIHKSELPKDF